MAKYLKEVLKGVKSSTKVTNDLGGYKPKAGDEEDFAKKHEIEKHADRVGNGDDVYKGTTKHVLANPKEKIRKEKRGVLASWRQSSHHDTSIINSTLSKHQKIHR